MEEKYSLAARLLIVSGKLSGLSEGFTFYQTPTGEKVNSRTLVAYLIAATIEDLKNRGVIDYKEGEIKAIIGGKLPILILNRKKNEGIGFEKIILEKLEKEKNLIDLVKDVIGGIYQIPEQRLLWLIRKEFPTEEYMRQEKVTMMFIFSRMETRWIPEKVTPLADKWLPELKPIWEKVLNLPWLKTAVRNVNFGLSATQAQEKDDDKD
jgi:hypothetical protein